MRLLTDSRSLARDMLRVAGSTLVIAHSVLAQGPVPDAAMRIDQLDFNVDPANGQGANSLVGSITIDYDLLFAAYPSPAPRGGFVNVAYLPNGSPDPALAVWLVQNLPIFGPGTEVAIPGSSSYPYRSISTTLDLAVFPTATAGQRLPNLQNIIVNYTPVVANNVNAVIAASPLPRIVASFSACRAIGGTGPINSVGYGRAPNLVGLAFPGPAANPVGQFVGQNHTNVQAALNQCGPMAIANSLQYLKANTPFAFLQNHVLGLGVPNNPNPSVAGDGTLVGDVDGFARRVITSRTTAIGQWPMNGLLRFAAQQELAPQLSVRHRVGGQAEWLPATGNTALPGNANYTFAGVTSTGAGNAYNHAWLVQEMSGNSTVTLDWQNATAHHYVQVVGSGYIARNPFVLHKSDLCQTNRDAVDGFGTLQTDFEWVDEPAGSIRNTNANVVQLISMRSVAPQALSTRCYTGNPVVIPQAPAAQTCGAIVAAEITIPESFIVGAVNPSFYIPHTWQGDLRVTLRKVGGPSVVIVDRPGVPGVGIAGFSAQNLGASNANRFRLSNIAAQRYDNPPILNPGINSPVGTWQPKNSLTPFVGINARGTWRLEVQDCNLLNVGQLSAFCLQLSSLSGAPIANPPCYANCDASTTIPFLNALDFACFLNRYQAGDPYANCDGSTTVPVLNALDFACYLTRYQAGCATP